MCDLCNLHFLILNLCSSLEKLPDRMGRLINLRCLDTFDCTAIHQYPKSIGKLTNLRQLIGVRIRTDGNHPKELSLGDLENLNRLVDLSMDLRGNATIDAGEVARAKFDDKTRLNEVHVHWVGTLIEGDISRAFNLPVGVLKFGYEDQLVHLYREAA